MGTNRTHRGPDIVLAGAARSGTTYLASQLGLHPRIDPGAIKESNYYSRRLDEGNAWYDGLYERSADLLRLDASVSYTYPQHAESLRRVSLDSPKALGVYVVRDPLSRAVSHYLYYRHYFKSEPAETFSDALRSRPWYLEVSDYERWFRVIDEAFVPGRRLVVPFPLVHAKPEAVTTFIYQLLNLAPERAQNQQDSGHRNQVVEYRSDFARRAVRTARRSRVYPAVRRALGADRVRSIRANLTRTPRMPTTAEALGSCDVDQLAMLNEFAARVHAAVRRRLVDQDAEQGLKWSEHWFEGREDSAT